MNSILAVSELEYYIMETDFSIGHFFNTFLENGDTILLKELVDNYGIRVPQERSVETYNKWIEIYQINQRLPVEERIKVIGTDPTVSYKFTFKHIIDLVGEENDLPVINEIRRQIEMDTTDFSPYYDSPAKSIMKKFVAEFEEKESVIKSEELNQIIRNLKISFDRYNRERVIYENYLWAFKYYELEEKKQFVRYGFGHLEKEREMPDYPTFFTILIEDNIYERDEILTVIGYLTKSQVLWDTNYDENGEYTGYSTEAGFGIGDYWKEYFRGIRKLKKAKLSDMTLFRLNLPESPYHEPVPDLIEIKMIFSKSNKAGVKGKATTRFLDYALLISDSKANRPLEELE